MKLAINKTNLLISITSAQIGIQWAFWMSIYPTAISFTEKLGDKNYSKPEILAWIYIYIGLGNFGGSF